MVEKADSGVFELSDDSLMDFRSDVQFGPYRIIEKIAGGGMAEIFKVVHEARPDHFLALKRIRSDRSDDLEFRKMMVDEAKIACRLKHRNIARVLGLHESNGILGLILEYVDGIDLIRTQRVLRERNAQLPIAAAVHLLLEILEGLEFAHRVRDEKGEPLHVVHRDVSPGNVMIDFEGNVRLVDWGIARAKNRVAHTEAGHVKGKFRYMAPEQITGKVVGPYTDLYSAAITFWEVVAGRRVYDQEELPQLMMKVARGEGPTLEEARAGLPRDLIQVWRTATARDPNKRYASAAEFSRALQGLSIKVDRTQCREVLRKLPLAARLTDTRRGYEKAVLKARTAAEQDLEQALLRALESPDRIEHVSIDSAAVVRADGPAQAASA